MEPCDRILYKGLRKLISSEGAEQIVRANEKAFTQKDAEEIVKNIRKRTRTIDKGDLQAFAEATEKAIDEEVAQRLIQAQQRATQQLVNRKKYNLRLAEMEQKEIPSVGLKDAVNTVDRLQNGWSGDLLRDFSTTFVEKPKVAAVWKDQSLENQRAIANQLSKPEIASTPELKEIDLIVKKNNNKAIRAQNKNGAFITEDLSYIARQSHYVFKIRSATGSVFKDALLQSKLLTKHGGKWKAAQQEFTTIARDRWKKVIRPLLDDAKTFKDIEDVNAFLDDIYYNLNSLKHINPNEETIIGKPNGGGSLATRISQGRVLHFKDGNAWFDYHQNYGEGSIQKSVMDGLNKSGHNIGLMEVFGANPEIVYNSLKGDIDKLNKKNNYVPTREKYFNSIGHIDAIWKEVTGYSNHSENLLASSLGKALRTYSSATLLGGLFFTQFSDQVNSAVVMKQFGVPLLKTYGNIIPDMITKFGTNASSKEINRAIRAMGALAELDVGGLIGRFQGIGTKLMGLDMTTYLKLTGSHATDVFNRGRVSGAIGNLMSSTLKEDAYEKVNKSIKDTLSKYNIDQAEYELFRQAKQAHDGFFTPEDIQSLTADQLIPYIAKNDANRLRVNQNFVKGAKLIKKLDDMEKIKKDVYLSQFFETGDTLESFTKRFEKASARNDSNFNIYIQNAKDELEAKYQSMIIDNANMVNLTPRAQDRALFTRGTPDGTFLGVFLRQLGQFQAVTSRQFGILKTAKDTGGIGLLAAVMAQYTAVGYLAWSAKSYINGDGIPDLDGATPGQVANIFGRSFIQGGMSYIGSNWILDANSQKDDLISAASGFLLGPSANIAADAYKAAYDLVINPNDSRGKTTLNFLKYDVPYMNLFYTKWLMNYMFMNELMDRVEPGYAGNRARRLQKQYNQEQGF